MHGQWKLLHPLCSWVWQLPRYIRLLWQHKYKHCCSTPNIFIQLTVTCNSTAAHTECIIVLTLQQWLRERATILRHT